MDEIPNNRRGRRFVTVAQMVQLDEYRWMNQSSMRHYIHDAEPRQSSRGEVIPGNGLSAAIVRIGRKILIDLDEFDAWIDRQREAGSVSSTKIVEREIDHGRTGSRARASA